MEKIVLGDLYKAYRKAKSEAFFDRGHFSSLAFADYEQDLEHNLTKLLLVLRRSDKWASRVSFLGAHTYVPKSIENPEQKKSRDIHFATLNPIEDWKRTCAAGKSPLKANFRPVIVASVNYQIVSALWII